MLSRLYCVLRKKRRVGAVTRRPLTQQANSLLRTVSRVFRTLEKLNLRIAEQFGAGDGDRTRNIQLGNLNFRSFIFNTYKIAQEKCTCMHCIPCMLCLICVSLGDVWGTFSIISNVRNRRFEAYLLCSK